MANSRTNLINSRAKGQKTLPGEGRAGRSDMRYPKETKRNAGRVRARHGVQVRPTTLSQPSCCRRPPRPAAAEPTSPGGSPPAATRRPRGASSATTSATSSPSRPSTPTCKPAASASSGAPSPSPCWPPPKTPLRRPAPPKAPLRRPAPPQERPPHETPTQSRKGTAHVNKQGADNHPAYQYPRQQRPYTHPVYGTAARAAGRADRARHDRAPPAAEEAARLAHRRRRRARPRRAARARRPHHRRVARRRGHSTTDIEHRPDPSRRPGPGGEMLAG